MKYPQNKISAAILSGGKSLRLQGKQKALLNIRGEKIIEKQIDVLSCLFKEIFVVSNNFFLPIPYKVVNDIYNSSGPLAGIHSALTHSKADAVFILSCDMPFISAEFISELILEYNNCSCDAIVPEHKKGIEPLHAIYSQSIKDKAKDVLQSDDKRIRNIYHGMNVFFYKIRDIYSAEKIFFNINSPEDLEKANDIDKSDKQ